MAKGHKPVAGSRAYWPKKRARRLYPRLNTHLATGTAIPLDFAGYKAGMTQVTVTNKRKGTPTEGHQLSQAATVLDCPPLHVHGIVIYRKTNGRLAATQMIAEEKAAPGLSRKTTVARDPATAGKLAAAEQALENAAEIRLLVHTAPQSSGMKKKRPELFELSLGGGVKEQWAFARQKLGQRLGISEVFRAGDWVDVIAVTTGKGVQGPVKRFGVKVRGRKHKKKQRHIGNIGARGPARVFPGAVAMAGQLGYQTRTEHNKRVLTIGSGMMTPKGGWLSYGVVSGDYVLLSGSVPGPKKRLIMLRRGMRATGRPADHPDVTHVVLDSQQGV